MADRKPFICIGMPVYNGEMFIRQALDSLLAQSYENFQLIISDNASTDATREICEEYAIKDIRIKYLRQKKNLGATNNFKYVLEQASGDYFMWAAHDDEWDARFIDTLIKVLEANKNVSVLFVKPFTSLSLMIRSNLHLMRPNFQCFCKVFHLIPRHSVLLKIG